jgi:hypothetical protein
MAGVNGTATLPAREADLAAPVPAVRYRFATDADGPAIGALFAAADYGDLGVDWRTAPVGGSWLLAERDGGVVGAIQVLVGHPYSVIGDCVVLPGARARAADGTAIRFGRPGEITLVLYAAALKMLKATGAQVAIGITRKAGMARLIGRYGGVPLGRCESFGKGLR